MEAILKPREASCLGPVPWDLLSVGFQVFWRSRARAGYKTPNQAEWRLGGRTSSEH